MLKSTHKLRFPKMYYPYRDMRLSGINLSFDLEEDYVNVTIQEDDTMVWDVKSLSATLLEAPGKTINLEIPRDNPYKVVHEMVAYALSPGKTDVPLRSIKKPPYDPSINKYLNMTPDFIEEIDGKMMIGELGTKYDSTEKVIMSVYSSKYSDLREKVFGAKLNNEMFCIIVSAECVFTDLEFDDFQINMLCEMFKLGFSAYQRLTSTYGLKPSDSNVSARKFRDDFNNRMSHIKLPESDNPLVISDSIIDFWYSEIPKVNFPMISRKLLSLCRDEANKYTKEKYTKDKFISQFDEFKNKSRSFGTKNKNDKGSFKIPFIIGEIESKNKPRHIENPTGNPYLNLANKCFGMRELQELEEEPNYLIENDDGEWKSTSDRMYQFLPIDLDIEDKKIFARSGLYAKSIKVETYKEDREDSKKQFDLDSNVGRIRNFISDHTLFDRSKGNMNGFYSDFKRISDFVMREFEDENSKNEILEFEEEFSRTKIGQQCQFMSLVAQELNFKIAKVSKKKGLYYSNISNTGWYVVCRPTGTHLFYCLIRYNDGSTPNFLDCFDEPVVNNNDITIFKWRSTDKDRITTWLTIYENMCVLYSDILSHYMYQKTDVALSKLLFTFLINCDNKQSTCDALYLWREMSMKLCSGDEYSRPGDVFDKLPKVRSSLSVFIINQMKIVGSEMVKKRPIKVSKFEEEEDDSEVSRNIDIMENSLDLITGLAEEKFENIIYTSYLACYHSYGTMSKMAAEFQVVEKIAEYELKMRDARIENMGRASPWGDIRDHEFNLHLSLLGGLLRRKMLTNIYKGAYDDHMYSTLMKAMSKPFMEFATFKASVNLRDDFKFDPQKQVSTVKAIETLMDRFRDMNKCVISPYDNLGQLFEHLFDDTQAKVDKKLDQAKGLREILTKDMMSRFFLNIIERFFELINKDSPSEVLSKGSMKERINKTIDDAIYELMEDGYELIVIDQTFDHSKWCQLFVMMKFASHMCPILPKQIFRFFCAILNKITLKRIILGKDFIAKMNQSDLLYSDTLKELRSQFKGESSFNDLIDKFEVALKNISNMGQGWLQNLSSSDGDTDMQIVSSVMEIWLQRLINTGKIPEDTKIYNFRIGSSDDQKQRKIIKIRVGSNLDVAKSFMRLCGMLPMVVSRHSCKKMSEPKTELFNMNFISEFNQLFSSGNTVFVGTCKFTRASLEIPVTTSLSDRFENFSNTRRNLIENGVDIFTSSLAQLMQMRVHYRSLGLGTDRLFGHYCDEILKYPSPSFGFFPWEQISLLGMFGNEGANYELIKRNSNSRSVLSKLLSNLDLRMGAKGEFGPTINFRLTKKDKYKRFKEKFEFDKDYFNKRPHILYLGPELREDTQKLIEAKACQSEAELSFVYDSTSKTFSTSFLFLREPIMKFSEKQGISRVNRKANIFGIIRNFTKNISAVDIDSVLPIFSSSMTIETIKEMMPDLSKSTAIPSRDLSRRRSTFYFSNIVGQMDIPLIDCVSQIWFGKTSGHNSKLTRDSFNEYKNQLSWLRDTHDETMKNGLFDFEDSFQLKNTLESMKYLEKKFSITSPIKQGQLDRMIFNYQKYNYKRGHVIYDIKNRPINKSHESEMYEMMRIINGPFSKEEKILFLRSMDLSEYKPELDNNLSRRKINLLWKLNRYKIEKNISLKEIINDMLISGKEYVPYFRLPQKKDKKGKYFGNMILDMIYESNIIRLELSSNKLTVISNGLTFLNSKGKDVFDMITKLSMTDMLKKDGKRLTSSGIIDSGSISGIPVETRKLYVGYDQSISGLDFDFDIDDFGRIKIRIKNSQDIDHFDYSFFIPDWKTSAKLNKEVLGYQDKWTSNVEYSKEDLEYVIRDFPEWSKTTFKNFMDARVIPSLMTVERSKQEIVEVDMVTDIYEMLKSADKIIEELDFEMREMGFINDEDDLDFLDLDSGSMGINIPDIDISKFEYESEIKIGRIGVSIFDRMISELSYLGIFDLYRSNYRLPIDTKDKWFDLFKTLCDYDKRPLLEKYKSSDDSSQTREKVQLGKDKINVRYKGKFFSRELAPAIKLFEESIYFENDDSLPVAGIFVDINGHKEHLKIKSSSPSILNTFVSYILDKIGVEDDFKLKMDKRNQTFEFSKEDVELSEKVNRYWKRFNRYKDDFNFAPDFEEFYVNNPHTTD